MVAGDAEDGLDAEILARIRVLGTVTERTADQDIANWELHAKVVLHFGNGLVDGGGRCGRSVKPFLLIQKREVFSVVVEAALRHRCAHIQLHVIWASESDIQNLSELCLHTLFQVDVAPDFSGYRELLGTSKVIHGTIQNGNRLRIDLWLFGCRFFVRSKD